MSATAHEQVQHPVRVLHIIDHFGPGGAQEALLSLVKYAARSKFAPEVAVLAKQSKDVYWSRFEATGVPLHCLGNSKYDPSMFLNLWKLAQSKDQLGRTFHIGHFHLEASNYLAKPIVAAAGVPVRINHDQQNAANRQEKPWLKLTDQLTNRLSDRIIAVSSSIKDFLAEHERIPAHKISVILNGLDLDRVQLPLDNTRKQQLQSMLEVHGISPSATLVLGIGRLTAAKNFDTFLEVAAKLSGQRPDVLFAIAGKGPDEADLRRKAESLDIADKVYFLGYVSNLPVLLQHASAVLMTSRYEGTPLTLLEAMALKVPIVASAVDGNAEILSHWETGWLVEDYRNVDGYVEGLTTVLDSRDIREEWVEAAHQRLHAALTADIMTREVERVYAAVLRSKGLPVTS